MKQPKSRGRRLVNTFSYRRRSWCLERRPSGRKVRPRTLRNCRHPLRPAPGSSTRPWSRCSRSSATEKIVCTYVVSRVSRSLFPLVTVLALGARLAAHFSRSTLFSEGCFFQRSPMLNFRREKGRGSFQRNRKKRGKRITEGECFLHWENRDFE